MTGSCERGNEPCCERRVIASMCLSVCLSVRNDSVLTGRISLNIRIKELLPKSITKFNFGSKLSKCDISHKDVHRFASCSILLGGQRASVNCWVNHPTDVKDISPKVTTFDTISNIARPEHNMAAHNRDIHGSLQCSKNLISGHSVRTNELYALPHCSLNIKFHTILPTKPRSSQLSLSLKFLQ